MNTTIRHKITNLAIALALAITATAPSALAAVTVGDINTALSYPTAERGTQVDDYHGTKVEDPYRWLEDANAARTKEWIEDENRVTFTFLDTIPARKAIKARLTKLWDYEKYGVPDKEGNNYFYTKNNGLQNQSVLYTTTDLSKPGRVLLDPNTLTKDGTVALTGVEPTDDGKLMAYGLSTAGSDWEEWKVKDVATGEDLPDVIKFVKFSATSWTKDNKGFFYSRYDEPNEATKMQDANYFQKLYYHKLGTGQADDTLVYERKDEKEWEFSGHVTEDGRYLIITQAQGTNPNTRIFYKDLTRGSSGPVVELLNKFDARYDFIGNSANLFWFRTDLNAPKGRVVAIDIAKPAQMTEVIPETSDKLEDVSLVGNKFIATYLKDAHSNIVAYPIQGNVASSKGASGKGAQKQNEVQVELPGLGTTHGFNGKRKDNETYYLYTGFTTPPTIYRYDIATNKSSVVFQPKVDFNASDYTTEQVFYQSKDGTKVPMFISYKKGLNKDGNNPCLLYGYGGFDISITPTFSVTNMVWMQMGGIYAVPNLRGGGEYGEAWHQAGMKEKKQNVFDDFIAAAQFLIDNKYTNSSKLAIQGGSNGGLLVGAAETQRPELFAAALPAVGVMDMLRFHKYTIGWAWTQEYGSSDDENMFKVISAYSPLHNIKSGVSYPATLITTGDHDDRVVPAHSFKFAATMQADQGGNAPILIRIETRAGHGAGKPTTKKIEESCDQLSFIVKAMNMANPTF